MPARLVHAPEKSIFVMKRPLLIWLTFALMGPLNAPTLYGAGEMKAGVGRAVLTPPQAIWLAGYASRTAPSDGKIHDLFAKVLAFEDDTRERTVLVTTDLLGLPASLVHKTAELAREKFGLPRERIMFTFSHTHCGPVIHGDSLENMYGLDEKQATVVMEYTQTLPALLLQAIGNAITNLESSRLEWDIGRASFAVNRRQYTLTGIINGLNHIGPVDHDVPVLKVSRRDGSIKAVLHGYACHNTTLSFQKLCGDYAGFSQAYLEEKFPGSTALFVCGCGADANPQPRGKLELAQKYGMELGEAVLAVLKKPMTPVVGPVRAAFKESPLAFSPPPSRSDLEKQLTDPNIYVQRRAKRLLKILDDKGALLTTYPYPIQVWQFADSLQMTALAGEVVADYSLRLKYELGRERTWVIAYANDFCAYIPSLRVLREGGYEGGDSMIYFGHHGPWAPTIEQDILNTVLELTRKAKSKSD